MISLFGIFITIFFKHSTEKNVTSWNTSGYGRKMFFFSEFSGKCGGTFPQNSYEPSLDL